MTSSQLARSEGGREDIQSWPVSSPASHADKSACEGVICGTLQDAENFESRQSSKGYKPPGARRGAGNGAGNGNARAAAGAANGSAREGIPVGSGVYGALELDPEDAFEAEAALAGLGVRRSSLQPLDMKRQ